MNKNKLFTIAITGSLLLSSSFNVFALGTNYSAAAAQSPKSNCTEMHHKKGHRPNVDKWVEEGIISKEQADQWKEFNKKHAAERKKEMEKVKKMSEEERKAYFEKMRAAKKDYFSKLVEEGIITKEQAEQIKERISQRHKNKEKEKEAR